MSTSAKEGSEPAAVDAEQKRAVQGAAGNSRTGHHQDFSCTRNAIWLLERVYCMLKVLWLLQSALHASVSPGCVAEACSQRCLGRLLLAPCELQG
jgi:hypothetical protein